MAKGFRRPRQWWWTESGQLAPDHRGAPPGPVGLERPQKCSWCTPHAPPAGPCEKIRRNRAVLCVVCRSQMSCTHGRAAPIGAAETGAAAPDAERPVAVPGDPAAVLAGGSAPPAAAEAELWVPVAGARSRARCEARHLASTARRPDVWKHDWYPGVIVSVDDRHGRCSPDPAGSEPRSA